MRRSHLLGASALGALASAVVPITALLLLAPAQYGAFSFAYLIFAFGWSLELSIVCDTWSRTRTAAGGVSGWGHFAAALSQLCILAGLVAGIATLALFNDALVAAAMAVGVAFNLYRLGGRFFRMASGNHRSALLSDAATLLVFGAVTAGLAAVIPDSLTRLAVAWALSSVLGSFLFPPGARTPRSGLLPWYRAHRKTVQALLSDSILMDVGANAVPAAFAPFMGAANFGIYRGISSVATPVQLILDPLRPNLAQLPARRMTRGLFLAAVVGTAVLMAAACYVILVGVVPLTGLKSTVLGAISPYAAAAALFVAANFFGHFYYIGARNHLHPRRLILGRIIQTIASIVLPTLGLVLGSLPGAIWGFVAASIISSTSWHVLLRVQSRDRQDSAG